MLARNCSENCAAQVRLCIELWRGNVPSASDGANSRAAAASRTGAGWRSGNLLRHCPLGDTIRREGICRKAPVERRHGAGLEMALARPHQDHGRGRGHDTARAEPRWPAYRPGRAPIVEEGRTEIPVDALFSRRELEARAQEAQHLAALDRYRIGHGADHLVTARGRGEADAVLPEVGSMMVLTPGLILPAFSAASIMATPMRSFTDDIGFKNSSLARTSPDTPARWGRSP